MAEGLASIMAYGDGSGNTITHFYAGDQSKKKKKKRKKKCKKN